MDTKYFFVYTFTVRFEGVDVTLEALEDIYFEILTGIKHTLEISCVSYSRHPLGAFDWGQS